MSAVPAPRRVEYNPTGDVWLPADVLAEKDTGHELRLRIRLDDNQQVMGVDARFCRDLAVPA